MILTTKEQVAMTPERRVHFLNEGAVRICKSLGDRAGLKALGVHLVEIEPGKQTTEFHFHHHEEECVYILSGTLELRLGDEVHTLHPGDFVGHPAGGEPHLMRNVSDEAASYLLLGQRLEKDVVDYPDINKRLLIDGDETVLIELDATDAPD